MLKRLNQLRRLSTESLPQFDFDYICDPNNFGEIRNNILNRKSSCDYSSLFRMAQKYDVDTLRTNAYFLHLLRKIPNSTHPSTPIGDSHVISQGGGKPEFDFPARSASVICAFLGHLRTSNTGPTTGPRSYYLTQQLAELEEALCDYALDVLHRKGFQLLTVPEILPESVIECCGVVNDSDRSLVYRLGGGDGLSGTSELALAGFNSGRTFSEGELPGRLSACSRCYRAEVSTAEEGIYRVHQFRKVEMFGVTTQQQSEGFLHSLLETQREIFDGLGLHYRVLDMSSEELGASAYRKFDIEAWLPSSKSYGEISSCSNCTDYQSRRLGIRYRDGEGVVRFAHTLNGTALASPRLLIPLIETHQTARYCVDIPEVLRPYMSARQITEGSPVRMTFSRALPKLEDIFKF